MNIRLKWWALVAPALLIVLYALLILVALGEQENFYGPMDMPLPNHGFMHISWTGKTAAIWLMLVLGTATRQSGYLLLALIGVVVQQVGDFIAGARTDVDVVVTQAGFGLWCLSALAIGYSIYRTRKSALQASSKA